MRKCAFPIHHTLHISRYDEHPTFGPQIRNICYTLRLQNKIHFWIDPSFVTIVFSQYP